MIFRKHRLAWAAAWLLGGVLSLHADAFTNTWLVDVWGIEEGLPQNSVISIAQSREGYLWLGTLNGLARFDGARFTTFNESNTRGLDSGRIVYLFEDHSGTLWVGTETAGAALIRNGEFRSLDLGRGSSAGRLVAATEDATGAVWLYTADGQLARYDGGNVNVGRLGDPRASSCHVLVPQADGGLLVGVDWGIYSIEPTTNHTRPDLRMRWILPSRKLDYLVAAGTNSFWRLADGRIQKWTADRVTQDTGAYPWGDAPVAFACVDHDGNLVVGTGGRGVFWFDAAGNFANISMSEGLSNNYILSLLPDREGNLWVGTDGGGLNRVRRPAFDVVAASRDAVVQSVCADGQGGVWFSQGGGVGHLQDGHVDYYGATNGVQISFVSAVFVDRKQNIWAGTRTGELFQWQTNHFEIAAAMSDVAGRIFAIHQSRDGNLWLGAQGGLYCWDWSQWRIYTTNTGLSADVVRAIAEDGDGNLWIGTENGGLDRLRDGKFSAFHKTNGLPSDNITALYADTNNVLWVGTDGGGLAWLQSNRWSVVTTREGLASDSVGFLLEGDHDDLWLGSYDGLMRVPKASFAALAAGVTNVLVGRNYDKSDGLPTSECSQGSQPAATRLADGTLWFPTIKGLVSVNPARLALNTNPPPVVIESVLIDGRPVETNLLRTMPSTVTLSPGHEQLEIHYASLNLSAPDRARFRYRLAGHESAWVDAGDSRVVRYPKLPPGDYAFAVTACNEDGIWNAAGAGFAVTVLPPFWRTWWFLTLAVVALLGAVSRIVHYFSTQKLNRQLQSLRQKEALEKERSRIARDLHDQIGANLTQVALLGEFADADRDQPAEVEAHAKQISKTARDTTRALDEIVWAANPANDTLESLINYTCKYAQDFCALAGLRYRLDVPADVPNVALPPEIRHNLFLAFKEAVNNMVKHAQATEARIRLRVAPDTITLEVEDNGRGPGDVASERAQTRNGMRNMRKRMEDIGGQFAIAPGPAGGTVVRLTVPLKTA